MTLEGGFKPKINSAPTPPPEKFDEGVVPELERIAEGLQAEIERRGLTEEVTPADDLGTHIQGILKSQEGSEC